MKMDFNPYFSDESTQNAATTYENIKKFVNWMYENNLFTKDGIIYYTTYRCSKQYRCSNEMWLLSILEFANRVIIDRCINDLVHGRSKIDDINGSDK